MNSGLTGWLVSITTFTKQIDNIITMLHYVFCQISNLIRKVQKIWDVLQV